MLPFAAIFTILILAIGVLLFAKSEQPELPTVRHCRKANIETKSCRNYWLHSVRLNLGAIYGLMPLELLNRGIAHDDLGSNGLNYFRRYGSSTFNSCTIQIRPHVTHGTILFTGVAAITLTAAVVYTRGKVCFY